MTVSLSMLGGAGAQFFDNSGNPLTGGLLYTYDAGTTTPRASYTSLSGGTPNTNPIVLDAAGRTPSEIWLTNGVLYKFVLKTSDGVLLGTYDNISSQGYYTDLQAALAASSGSSLVGFIASGAGAVAETVQTKLRQTVHIDDYNGDIAAAVAALPAAGGTIVFGAATYRSPYYGGNKMTKDNITFQGAGRPNFNDTYTGLTGGTIIIGPFNWGANSTTFRDLGIDSGLTVCNTYYSGTPQEGLASGDPQAPATPYWENNKIFNVSVICKEFNSAGHAILFENQRYGELNNIRTTLAAAGIVIKGSYINSSDTYGRNHRQYTYLIKSDYYAPSNNINLNNVICENSINNPVGGGQYFTEGVVLLSTTAGGGDGPVEDININNVQCIGTVDGIFLDANAGSYIKNVNISNFYIHQNFFAGVYMRGVTDNIRFVNGMIDKSDYGFVVGASSTNTYVDSVTSYNSGHACFSNSGVGTVFENCVADLPYSVNYPGFLNDAGSSVVRTPTYRNITTNTAVNTGGTQTIEDIVTLNTVTSTILEYLRRQLISQIEAITGAGSIVAAWFGVDNANVTTMPDYSTYGTHTATFRNGSTLVAQPPIVTGPLGMGNNMSYDANRVYDTPDAADLSFGNGVTDSPFSVMTVCQPIVSFIGQVAAKMDLTTASPQREWYFQLTSSSGLYLGVIDNSTGGYLLRRDSNSLSPYNLQWTTFTGTYDGSATAAGLKVYINDTETTNQNLSSGAYTAMENTTAKVGCYNLSSTGTPENQIYAGTGATLIFNVELSAADVIAVRALLQSYFNL